jgi:hypothetical protein
MEQVVVEKRGSYSRRHWTQRVLSLFTHLGVVAISQDGHVENNYHKCVHVTSVQMWPHYKKSHVREDFDSMEAKLTIRVKGFAVRVGDRVVNRAEGPVHVYSYTQRNAAVDMCAWMLRFATYADLERTVHLFEAIRAPTSQSKMQTDGTEAATTTAKLSTACEEASAAAAVAVEDGDLVAAECTEQQEQKEQPHLHHNDSEAPLADELDAPGLTPSTVLEGDVASDLDLIRSQWQQFRNTTGGVA